MSVIQRGSSWQAEVNHGGKRYRRQFPVKREAEAWALEAKAALVRGNEPALGEQASAVPGRPQTLGQLRDYVVKHQWAPKPGSIKTIHSAGMVVDILGASMPIAKIGVFEVNRVLSAARDRGNSNATINRKLASLKIMLSAAVDLDLIPKRPKIKLLKENERRRFRLTPDMEVQMHEVFTRLSSQHMIDWCIFCIDTGARPGKETRKLQWSDFHNDAVTFSDTKGGDNRTVPLTSRVKAMLALRRAGMNGRPTDKVFEGLPAKDVRKLWQAVRTNLDLDDEPSFIPYIMRHEFCSRLADKFVPAQIIMTLAGHSTMDITMRYINLAAIPMAQVMKAMEPANANL